MYPYYCSLPSYLTLLELQYGNHVQRNQVAWEKAEEAGISVQELERWVDLELFLDEYPQWGLGTPHQLVVLHEMFLHTAKWGQKEAECIFCQGSIYKPDPEADQSTMELVGYWMSRKEMRDIYHSVYLLRRSPGSPSCGEWQRRKTIQNILSSLTDRLQRWASLATSGDLDLQGGEWVRQDWQGSYEVTLQVAHQRALETTEALQSDLKRLHKEQRERSQAHPCSWSRSQSRAHPRSWSRTHSRGQSRSYTRANSQSCSLNNLGSVCPWSPNESPPRKRVTFNDSEEEKGPAREEAGCSTEPSVGDLDMGLEFQAGQLGTPAW